MAGINQQARDEHGGVGSNPINSSDTVTRLFRFCWGVAVRSAVAPICLPVPDAVAILLSVNAILPSLKAEC
jgi:hypothetical protein